MILLLLVCSVFQLEARYDAGEYEAVVEMAPAVLAESARSRADSIRVDQLHAFSLVALGRNYEATRVFRRLLFLDPGLVLDPRTVSPKIRAVFDKVKQESRAVPEPVPMLRSDTVRLRQPVPLSVLVPGLGQIHNGRRGKGYAIAGLGLASVAGLVVSHVGYNRARTEYLAATEPADVTRTYNTANNWYRARTVLVGTTTITWLYSLVDALLNP